MATNAVRSMRDISARYARSGSRDDFDEFRAEMRRISDEQRFQTLERYINEIYQDYPFLVRNRYHQFVPIRNARLSELIQSAVAEQQALNDARQALKEARAQATAAENASAAASAAAAAKSTAAATGDKEKDEFEFADYLPQILLAVAVIMVLVLAVLIFVVWQFTHALSTRFVVAAGGGSSGASTAAGGVGSSGAQ